MYRCIRCIILQYLCIVPVGPADYNDCPTNFTLFATTNSTTTAKLEFTIIDDDILERDEVLTIVLDTTESRVNIANSTSVIILNDNGQFCKLFVY